MQNSFLVILPKLSSYRHQDDTEKLRISKTIKAVVDKLSGYGYIPAMIAEDELAIELLGQEEHLAVSALPRLGRAFIIANTTISSRYEGMGRCLELNEYTKEAAKKIKLRDRAHFDGNDQEYDSYKVDIYNKRIRHTVSGYYNAFQIIVFFDKKNNYANTYKPKKGDKKLYMEVDLNTELSRCYFTGITVADNMFYQVAEGLKYDS